MLTARLVVIPIFALIFVGFGCRRSQLLGANATSELNRFVVILALPALMFDITAHMRWATFYQPGFIAATGGGAAIVFIVTVFVRWRQTGQLADASLDGLNAGYANTGFIGFPLCLAAFGSASTSLTAIATVMTACVLFALAIVLIEIGSSTSARIDHVVAKVGKSLVKNPLLIAPVLGAAFAGTGWVIPEPIEVFLRLLGNAASPCALVALGLFLGQRATASAPSSLLSTSLILAKLLAQPAITWVIAAPVLHLPSFTTHVAVALAAMPTGTGPFMLAEFYRRESATTSRTILLSTIGAVLTLSAYLAMIQ
jgi:predicted permease